MNGEENEDNNILEENIEREHITSKRITSITRKLRFRSKSTDFASKEVSPRLWKRSALLAPLGIKPESRNHVRYASNFSVNVDLLDNLYILCRLSQCIRNNDCKAVKTMLRKNVVDVNILLEEAGSLLHEEAYVGCTKCIKTLLKFGSYVNMEDEHGWTPLHAAVLGCNVDATKLLLQHNAFPNRQNFDGLSSCHLAVIADDLQLLHELMSAGGQTELRRFVILSPCRNC